jgi:hypothetical protein
MDASHLRIAGRLKQGVAAWPKAHEHEVDLLESGHPKRLDQVLDTSAGPKPPVVENNWSISRDTGGRAKQVRAN